MPDLDPTAIDLAEYPLRGTFRFPSRAGLLEAVRAGLPLPEGVQLSDEPRGASWASWVVTANWQFPPERDLAVHLRVLGIVREKRLGEALAVSFVALEGDRVVAASEDHAFKPPRPALLAFVGADGAPVPITDAIRAAVAAKATPLPGKGGKAKVSPATGTAGAAKDGASPPKGKGRAGNAAPSDGARFVVDTPIRGVALAPSGATFATIHTDPTVVLWSIDGQRLRALKAGGGGMITTTRPAFSPDGAKIATGASDVRIFDAASGEELGRPDVPKKSQVERLFWRPDGLYVSLLAPKDLVLLRFDPAGVRQLGEWKWKREPGMVSQPLPDGTRVHLAKDADLARLDLGSGAVTPVRASEKLVGEAVILGLTREGLWVGDHDKHFVLFDADSSAFRRELRFARTPGHPSFAADGSGFVACLRVGDDEVLASFGADGVERARWPHGSVEGLPAYLAALREAGKDKDTRRYLDYSDRPSTTDIALLPSGDVVVTTGWTIAVYGPSGERKLATTL